jgi:hypothetical protein
MISILEALAVNTWDNKNISESLQNRVVLSARNNFSDVRNVVPSFAPISLD